MQMLAKKLIIATLFLNVTAIVAVADSLVIESRLFDYNSMSQFLESKGKNLEKHFKYCCHYRVAGKNSLVKFDERDSYFAYLKMDNRVLVKQDMENGCKTFWGNKRTCTKEEIEKEYSRRLKTYQAIVGWYGKYHNRFIAWSGIKRIPDTQRHIGQSLDFFERSGSMDEIVVGPLPEKPTKLELVHHHGKKIVLFED